MRDEGGVLVVAADPADRRAMLIIGGLALLVGVANAGAFAWLAWTDALNLECALYAVFGIALVGFGARVLATRERVEIDGAAGEVRFVVSTFGRRRVERVPLALVSGVRVDVIGHRARVVLLLEAEVRPLATEPVAEADRLARAITDRIKPAR
jgi:hypothetical protein